MEIHRDYLKEIRFNLDENQSIEDFVNVRVRTSKGTKKKLNNNNQTSCLLRKIKIKIK